MPQIEQLSVDNILLRSLPPAEFAVFETNLEWVDLKLQSVLCEANENLSNAYFPASGYCSMISINGDVRVETGLIGREGFVGAPLVLLADRSPYTIMVQAEGQALRISPSFFAEGLKQCPTLNSQLLRFIHIFTLQTAQTSLANAHYKIVERLARWLLMCHDRGDSDDIVMTHQFLSLMLSVRRSGITDALHELEGKRIIRSVRGVVKILDRAKLEKASRGAYGIPESEYARLIAPLKRPETMGQRIRARRQLESNGGS
jgi:CRP-like cAMP-binding protein